MIFSGDFNLKKKIAGSNTTNAKKYHVGIKRTILTDILVILVSILSNIDTQISKRNYRFFFEKYRKEDIDTIQSIEYVYVSLDTR